VNSRSADKQLEDNLTAAFPRAFRRIERSGGMQFETSSTWSRAKRLFAFAAGREFTVVLEIDLPSNAPIRNQAPESEAALLIVGCLCTCLQAHGFDVSLLSDRGFVSGLLVSTRLCRDHARAADLKAPIDTMRALAPRVDIALRSSNDGLRLLRIALQPRIGSAIAPTIQPGRRRFQLGHTRSQARRPQPKGRAPRSA